jgi:heptosyltransferase-2
VLAICPGAEYGEAKQWPAEYWAGLVSRATASGYRVWLFGSAKDRTIAQAISERLSSQEQAQFRDLAGATSLDDAIDLLSKVQACVSNDSGLMHVAAALSVPVVAIYGSTSPDFTPPLSSEVKLLFTDIECRPCFQRSCPLGHLRCLHDIDPDQVFTSVLRLLNKEPG